MKVVFFLYSNDGQKRKKNTLWAIFLSPFRIFTRCKQRKRLSWFSFLTLFTLIYSSDIFYMLFCRIRVFLLPFIIITFFVYHMKRHIQTFLVNLYPIFFRYLAQSSHHLESWLSVQKPSNIYQKEWTDYRKGLFSCRTPEVWRNASKRLKTNEELDSRKDNSAEEKTFCMISEEINQDQLTVAIIYLLSSPIRSIPQCRLIMFAPDHPSLYSGCFVSGSTLGTSRQYWIQNINDITVRILLWLPVIRLMYLFVKHSTKFFVETMEMVRFHDR